MSLIFGTNRKPVCDFLLVNNPISPSFARHRALLIKLSFWQGVPLSI